MSYKDIGLCGAALQDVDAAHRPRPLKQLLRSTPCLRPSLLPLRAAVRDIVQLLRDSVQLGSHRLILDSRFQVWVPGRSDGLSVANNLCCFDDFWSNSIAWE